MAVVRSRWNAASLPLHWAAKSPFYRMLRELRTAAMRALLTFTVARVARRRLSFCSQNAALFFALLTFAEGKYFAGFGSFAQQNRRSEHEKLAILDAVKKTAPLPSSTTFPMMCQLTSTVFPGFMIFSGSTARFSVAIKA